MQHTCQICNKTFDSPHRKAKLCSRECANTHRSIIATKERVCELCGKELVSPGQKKLGYCSIECRDNDTKRIVIGGEVHTTCTHCGKAFTHAKWRNLKFCSKECAHTSRKTVTMVHATCQQCGTDFIHRSNVKRNFCSKKCWHKFGIGENSPHYSSVNVSCEQCGKAMKREPNHANRVDHNFCCNRCRSDWHSANIRGEVHPLWKGGADNNRGPNWLAQRRKAWKRDNYTCQHCGTTKKQLKKNPAVHHIIPFRDFGIERYEEANELTNLITLCPTCHMRAEHNLIPIQPYLLAFP